MEETGEQSPENGPENEGRDENGRFAKGQTIGKEFEWTPETAPKSAGRPKRKHLTDALMKHLNDPASKREFTRKIAIKLNMNPEEATGFDVLVMSAFMHSLKGKGDILKQVWERIEGSVPKSMTLDFDDPVQVYIDQMRNATQPKRPDAPDDQNAAQPCKHGNHTIDCEECVKEIVEAGKERSRTDDEQTDRAPDSTTIDGT